MYPYDSDVLASSMHAVDVDPNPYTLSPPPHHNPKPQTPHPGRPPHPNPQGGGGTRTHAHAQPRRFIYLRWNIYIIAPLARVMDEDVVDYNAGASHEEVEANGSAMDPSLFPDPAVGLARRVRANLYNPQQPDLGVLEVDRVVYQIHPDGSPPARAYWLGRKLSKTILGCVRSCTVLTLREGSKWTGPESGEAGGGAIWLVTADTLAVKMMSWPMVQKHMGELGEDGWKEVAAMQWIGQAGTSPHVLDAIDVLRNDEAMYLFMPLGTGSLFETAKTTFERSGAGRFPEPFARGWFRQLLSVSRCSGADWIAAVMENDLCHV